MTPERWHWHSAETTVLAAVGFLFLAWTPPATAQGTCRCLTTEALQVPARCTQENQGATNTGTARGKCAGTDPKCPVEKECTVTEEVVCRGDHWEPTGEKRTDTCRDAVKQEKKEEKEERKEAKQEEKEEKKHCGRVSFKNPPIITGRGETAMLAIGDFRLKVKAECRQVCEKRTEHCEGEKKCQMVFPIADEPSENLCSGGQLTERGRRPVSCSGTLRGCQCECK